MGGVGVGGEGLGGGGKAGGDGEEEMGVVIVAGIMLSLSYSSSSKVFVGASYVCRDFIKLQLAGGRDPGP